MNEIVKKAMNMQEECYKNSTNGNYLPDVEIGETCEINDIWDGDGECPTENGSKSYQLTDTDWINYVFDVIEEKDNELDTLVKITDIELL